MNIIGKTIANRYEIISTNGVGGMATVYKAKDTVLNRNVAIKVLKEEFITDEEFVKRFNSEAQAAASLSHPNIVSIYDVGNEDNIYYIVMELVRGKTLKQIITEEGALPWKWSVNIAMQIASALETAHKNNIVHRDIKPHNIIITEDGVAKVTDFGIAKAVSNSTITAFGTTIGSVHYFSPEQAKGGYTDAKSDIYSLGVVMYEMLTGKVPFDSDTSVSVALMHMQEKPVPPMEINDNIPQAVNDIILKAMQKEPMARYQTATAMISDLQRALKEPDGDFVGEDSIDVDDGLTRRMDAITPDMERTTSKKKKQNKFVKYIKEHPAVKVLLIILAVIVLALASYGVTSAVMGGGKKDVQIPELTGLTEEQAMEKVKQSKLVYEKESEDYNADFEEGQIYEQDPKYKANYTIKEGTKIKVKVSKGTEKVTVPKVIGKTYDEAVRLLEEAKLKAEKVEETSKTVAEGTVISQEVEANTEANSGDTIKIHVSIGTGIAQVVMPNVVGYSEENAKNTLTGKNLKVTVEYTEDTSKNNGEVVAQSVEKGKNIDEETEVTITVNKLAETKTAKVKINVKSLTKYEENSSSSGTSASKNEKVTVIVNGETRTKVDRSDTDYEVEISGNDGEKVYVNIIITSEDGKTTYYSSSSRTVTFGKDTEISFK